MATKEFELTDEEYNELLEACKPTRCMMIGSYAPPTPQENANRAWQRLGKKRGFNYDTVRPILGKGPRFFTAEATTETEDSDG